MGTKNNPGDYDCYNKAADDEPVFTLRAKDEDAPYLVLMWVAIRTAKWKALNPDIPIPENYLKKLTEAELCARSMFAWKSEQESHGDNSIPASNCKEI